MSARDGLALRQLDLVQDAQVVGVGLAVNEQPSVLVLLNRRLDAVEQHLDDVIGRHDRVVEAHQAFREDDTVVAVQCIVHLDGGDALSVGGGLLVRSPPREQAVRGVGDELQVDVRDLVLVGGDEEDVDVTGDAHDTPC